MSRIPKPTRRGFLSTAAVLVQAPAFGQQRNRILIQAENAPTFLRKLAARELLRGLRSLRLPGDVRLAGPEEKPRPGDRILRFRISPDRFTNGEAYAISADQTTVTLRGPTDRALLFATFDFLDRQGAFFGIDGESYPLDPLPALLVPHPGEEWAASPRFSVRGLMPWPDFLNGISVFNDEDYRAYFEAMLRMRFNTFAMHVYSSGVNSAESFLSFEYAGAGHHGFLDTTATGRWGYLPERTSQFTMGAAQFYDAEVFGSDAARFSRDPWEEAERTRTMLRKALVYAKRLGLSVGIGFEPYQVPDEILRALPPEAKPPGLPGNAAFDVESVSGRRMLDARLGQLLDAYPEVDHVWLWEAESASWSPPGPNRPSLSVTPFLQTHDFLRRHAPKTRLVLSGWGGVSDHFEDFHKRLPMDVVFACLNDRLGWDPVAGAFGKLEGRERWPVPWLEDDSEMWQPQFLVNRWEKDMNLAEGDGCQGILGIHWRHRIVDPTAGFLSRFSWDRSLTPGSYYEAYARGQAAGARIPSLAAVLADTDQNHKILSSATGQVDNGHAVLHGYSPDYAEGFTFWGGYSPDPKTVESQKEIAGALVALRDRAASGRERERIGYLAGQLEFVVSYTQAWEIAQHLQKTLDEAAKLKQNGQLYAARLLVRNEGVPIWFQLAPVVRRAMLTFQSIAATRSDLGTLASLHNKFVRLALTRLPLSIREYLEDLPAAMEKRLEEVNRPNGDEVPRLIVPTRPTLLLSGESVGITVVGTGLDPLSNVRLHSRMAGSVTWSSAAAQLLGRRTYRAPIGPFAANAEFVDYYVSAMIGTRTVVGPPDAPAQPYHLTVL